MEINNKSIKIGMLIAMFLLLLCCIQSASAANQSITNTTGGGISSAINAANAGDTVFLAPGNYSKNNQDFGVTLTKNITLMGNGSTDSVIIDARKQSRIFTMGGSGLNVTFINITFLN